MKSTSLIKKSQIQVYFDALKESDLIKGLQKSVLDLATKVNETDSEKQGDLKKDFAKLKKDIETERAKINEPINEIKMENQAIFKPIMDSLEMLKKESEKKYSDWYRAESERRRKYQEELNRKAEEERKKQEELRKEAEGNNRQILPDIPITAPTIAPIEINKQMFRKSLTIEIYDKIAFIEFAMKTRDPELMDCIEITNKKGIEAKCRRNPGEVKIGGTNIIYNPDLPAWLTT